MVGEIINRFRQRAASAYRRAVQQVGPRPGEEQSHSGAPGSSAPGRAQEVGGVPYAAAPTAPGADRDQAEFAVAQAYGTGAPAPDAAIEPAEPAVEPGVEPAVGSVPTEPDVPIEPAEPAVEPPVPDEPLEPLEPVEPPTPAEPDQPGEPLPPDPGLPEEPLVPTGAGEDFAADEPVRPH